MRDKPSIIEFNENKKEIKFIRKYDNEIEIDITNSDGAIEPKLYALDQLKSLLGK